VPYQFIWISPVIFVLSNLFGLCVPFKPFQLEEIKTLEKGHRLT